MNDTSPTEFEESGCAICGKLILIKDLQKLSQLDLNMEILKQKGVSQKERKSSNDNLADLDGPIIEDDLDNICNLCYQSVSKGKLPQMALANGKWLGKIPTQLQDLSYAEQLLIAQIRHNRCLVQVSSGMRKMTANAISFTNPIPKVYKALPPPIEEMDEVLAFIYTGPCQPTKADFEQTPLLVRHKKVSEALEWLKLNHIDYFDIEISYDNLKAYPEDAPPVLVDYRSSTSNKNPEATAVNDMEEEAGTETGKCPFIVHGLTGEEYSTKSLKALKAIALKHITDNGSVLAIGYKRNQNQSTEILNYFPKCYLGYSHMDLVVLEILNKKIISLI